MGKCAFAGVAFVAFLAALQVASIAQAGVVVVVNPKNSVTALSKDQLADIYLGSAKNFPGGGVATPVDLPESAAESQDFHKNVTGKNGTQFKAYWAKMVFSGRGVPPKEAATAAEVKSLIATNPGMVGYIDKSAVDSSVKVVFEAN
jgi:ABC-type phosphate transport system substrate-binding protein